MYSCCADQDFFLFKSDFFPTFPLPSSSPVLYFLLLEIFWAPPSTKQFNNLFMFRASVSVRHEKFLNCFAEKPTIIGKLAVRHSTLYDMMKTWSYLDFYCHHHHNHGMMMILMVMMMKKTVGKSFSFEESGEADGGDGLHSQPIWWCIVFKPFGAGSGGKTFYTNRNFLSFNSTTTADDLTWFLVVRRCRIKLIAAVFYS